MNDESTGHGSEEQFEGDEARSLFSALWFRLAVGAAALGVVAAVAIPYVLDWTRPPVPRARAVASVPSPLGETAKPVAPASSAPAAMWTPGTPSAHATSSGAAAAPGTLEPTAKPQPTVPAPASSAAEKGETTAGTRSEPAVAALRTDGTPVAATEGPRVAPARATARMAGDASAGSYWVQVGAYKDATTAERLAAKLREQGYHVSELAPTPPAGIAAVAPPAPTPAPEPSVPRVDRYDVIVSGAPAATVTDRLVAKGLVADVTAAGVIVRPALSLPEAISLSKDLAVDGLKVQVRRAGIAATRTPATAKPATAPAAPAPDGLHRVRVGAYPDQATALAAVKELSARGYEGFVARFAQ